MIPVKGDSIDTVVSDTNRHGNISLTQINAVSTPSTSSPSDLSTSSTPLSSAPSTSPFPTIPISHFAARSRNPLRSFVESMRTQPIPNKPLIPLSLGDPTVFGNFPPPPLLDDAITAAVASHKHNGYIQSTGDNAARAAVAAYYNRDRDAMDPRKPLCENVSVLTLTPPSTDT